MPDNYIPGTIIPEKLLPMIGYVVIQHNQMDHAINGMIGYLAGVDSNKAIAITSVITSTAARLDIMRNLVTVATVPDSFHKTNSINAFRGIFGLKRAVI